jgi:hypothetical protein
MSAGGALPDLGTLVAATESQHHFPATMTMARTIMHYDLSYDLSYRTGP